MSEWTCIAKLWGDDDRAADLWIEDVASPGVFTDADGLGFTCSRRRLEELGATFYVPLAERTGDATR